MVFAQPNLIITSLVVMHTDIVPLELMPYLIKETKYARLKNLEKKWCIREKEEIKSGSIQRSVYKCLNPKN